MKSIDGNFRIERAVVICRELNGAFGASLGSRVSWVSYLYLSTAMSSFLFVLRWDWDWDG